VPLTYPVEITLYGNKQDKQFENFGNKVIYVENSKIDINGVARSKTWTYLKSSVKAGDSSFVLD